MANDFVWYSEELPEFWSYGVTRDGRVFFINDAEYFTTWCHPITGHPVQTGSYEDPNLPKGWQYDIDLNNRMYYIDHSSGNNSTTPPNFAAPLLLNPSPFRSQELIMPETKNGIKHKAKQSNSDKSPVVKRNLEAKADLEGWLLRQEGILRQWKKRWFVVSQQCLFCYEDIKEKRVLSTYILPGYHVAPCYGEPGILKQFAFKIYQKKMKTIYLADTNFDHMHEWLRVLRHATSGISTEDEVFRVNNQTGNDQPLPRHLAQRSQSVSASPSHKTQPPLSPHESPHKRSSSYHNFKRSMNKSTPALDLSESARESLNRSSMGRDVSPSRQGFIEQRSRTPVYSPSEKDVTDSKSFMRSSGNWNDRISAQNSPSWNNGNSFRNSNLNPEPHQQLRESSFTRGSAGSPVFRYSNNIGHMASNRISNSSYVSILHNNQPQNNYLAAQQNTPHSRMGSVRVSHELNGPPQTRGTQPGDLRGLDDEVKTWRSFDRDLDTSKNPYVGNYSLNSPRLNSTHGNEKNSAPNGSFMRPDSRMQPERPDTQLYSSVIRTKPRPQQDLIQQPNNNSWIPSSQNFSPNQPSSARNPFVDRNSGRTDRETFSSSQPYLDNFSSVSKYNSKPSLIAVHRLTNSSNIYDSKPIQRNIGHSAESLNTLKTTGSSKSSSKNTYYLSGSNNLLTNNNPESTRKNSYLVMDDGPNNIDPNQPPLQPPYSSNPRFTFSPPPTWGNFNEGRGKNLAIPTNFSAIKEDPDMPDDQVLTSRNLQDLQKKLASHTRLRLSISIQDLMGKSYEEVVLFLIQLKRSQSELHEMCEKIKKRLDSSRDVNHFQNNKDLSELERQVKDVEKQIEVTQPLINLLDNILTMGSLFSGDSLMYASQYKKNQLRPDELVPPKAMLEFNRSRQEALIGKALTKSQTGTHNNYDGNYGERGRDGEEASVEELEMELRELHRLDVFLQEHSCAVTSLQQDKEIIEQTLQEVNENLAGSSSDPYTTEHLTNQKHSLEKDLNGVILQLAHASKLLEQTTGEMIKSEQRVIQIRNKLQSSDRDDNDYGNHSSDKPGGVGNQRIRQMEQQVKEIGSVLKGTSDQMSHISSNITSIKRSRSSHSLPRKDDSSLDRSPNRDFVGGATSYLETDLDHNTTKDTSLNYNYSPKGSSRLSRKDEFYSKMPQDINKQTPNRSVLMPREEARESTWKQNLAPYSPQHHTNTIANPTLDSNNHNKNSNHNNSLSYQNLGPNGPTMGSQNLSSFNSDSEKHKPPSNRPDADSSSQQRKNHLTTNLQSIGNNYHHPFAGGSQKSVSVATVRPVLNSNHNSYDQKHSWDNEMVFDENTIDNAVFQPPPQVPIPQRYFPDPDESNDSMEITDPVQSYLKQQKAEQVKKLLAMHSLQEFTLDELGKTEGDINDRVKHELKEREDILEMKKNLAKQVKERSRNFVAM